MAGVETFRRRLMKSLRLLAAELLIELAFRILPKGSVEKYELAQFLVRSWIGEVVRRKKVF